MGKLIRFVSFRCLFVSLFFAVFVLPVQAVILDWSGVYEVEMNTLQNGDFEQWGSGEFFHNLHLKPDIKAFDGVHVRSWFLLTPQDTSQAVFTPQLRQDTNQSAVYRTFRLQKGVNFGNPGAAFPPLISVRDLYLEVVHDFGLFQIGWKPHHFGLGMYYNDSVKPFSSFYNSGGGSAGFLSWRGFIGSAYYVQPMVHYIDEALVNLFIQAGFNGDKYGAEIIYKSSSLGVTKGRDSKPNEVSSSYIGVYAYYTKENILNVQLEVAQMSGVYGGVINADWQTPVKWLNVGLDVGASTSNEKKTFYFHPSFSSRLSFLIEEYQALKSKKEEGTQYPGYSFHSGFYIAPSVHFSLSDSLSLSPLFSTHLSYSNGDVLFYHLELTLKYQIAEGLTWNTGAGVLFPKEDNWHIGFISQAAITF